MNHAPVAPRHTAPLPLIRYVRGTTEQEAAEPAVLREGSSSSGSGAALRTTTQVLAVVATCLAFISPTSPLHLPYISPYLRRCSPWSRRVR